MGLTSKNITGVAVVECVNQCKCTTGLHVRETLKVWSVGGTSKTRLVDVKSGWIGRVWHGWKHGQDRVVQKRDVGDSKSGALEFFIKFFFCGWNTGEFRSGETSTRRRQVEYVGNDENVE